MTDYESCGAQVWQVRTGLPTEVLHRCSFRPDHTGPHADGYGLCWSNMAPAWEPMCACGGDKSHCVGPR